MERVFELVPGSSSPRQVRGGRARAAATAAPGSSLAALVARLEQRAREGEQIHAVAPVADVLRAVIGDLQALAGPGPPEPAAADPAPALLTVREAAGQLGVSPKWLYRHPTLPFLRRLGPGVVRVDARALAAWLARRAG